jgi:hypothetical protein
MVRVWHLPRLSSGLPPSYAAFVLFRQPSSRFPAVGEKDAQPVTAEKENKNMNFKSNNNRNNSGGQKEIRRQQTTTQQIIAENVKHLPARRINVQVLRLLLDAIRRTIRIGIRYQSMSRTEPKERIISPHAIVFDGIRWHVRGYCHERNEFRDFVFARITDVSLDPSGLLGVSGDGDQAWNSFVEVKLAVAPHLSEGQKRAVEVDYGMDHGLLTLRVRQALLLYFYQQLPLFEPVGRARYNQIILENRESLLPHFEKLGIDL